MRGLLGVGQPKPNSLVKAYNIELFDHHGQVRKSFTIKTSERPKSIALPEWSIGYRITETQNGIIFPTEEEIALYGGPVNDRN